MSKKIKLSTLTPDNKNNNKHTAYGMDLLEKSVNKVGIIESITVSNDDKIISGNARHEVIGKHFEKEALVIETDGTQPIVIKRTDIESNTKQFYEASILANTTAKKNIDFDMEVIDALAVEYDIDVVDLGVDIVDYTKDNDVINTITAGSNYGFCHSTLPRPASKNELCLCGSFPLDYEFYNETNWHYLIGMSVPPVMTAQIAHQIYLQWFKSSNHG